MRQRSGPSNVENGGNVEEAAATASARLKAAMILARQHGFVVEFCTDADLQRLWRWRYGMQSCPFGRVLVLARAYASARRLWITDTILGDEPARMWLAAAAIERAAVEEIADIHIGGVMLLERHGKLVTNYRVLLYKDEIEAPTVRLTGLALLAWAWAAAAGFLLRREYGRRTLADRAAARVLRPSSQRETA